MTRGKRHSARRWACIALLAALVCAAPPAAAQGQDGDDDVHYVTRPGATLYRMADTTSAYLHLRFREPVNVITNGGRWAQVRTDDGAQGQIRAEDLSNVWIRVSKEKQTVYLYRGADLLARYAADLGYNFFDDKERRGSVSEPDHWRTPEGTFYVAGKNPNSAYYRALVLNYPSLEDAERGLRDSLITQAEFDAVARAERGFGMPPMNTALGGWIELHGNGTGQRANWTQGCIALTDDAMDRLWDWVEVGTPVVIER